MSRNPEPSPELVALDAYLLRPARPVGPPVGPHHPSGYAGYSRRQRETDTVPAYRRVRLKEAVALVERLYPLLSVQVTGQRTRETALMLAAASLGLGQQRCPLADFIGLSPGFVQHRLSRLRAEGLWPAAGVPPRPWVCPLLPLHVRAAELYLDVLAAEGRLLSDAQSAILWKPGPKPTL